MAGRPTAAGAGEKMMLAKIVSGVVDCILMTLFLIMTILVTVFLGT